MSDSNTKIGPTILERFRSSREPFAIVDSRLYTVGTEVNKKGADHWNYLSQIFPLFESNTMKEFEEEFFSDNEQVIERYMTDMIRFKIMKRLDSAQSSVKNSMNYYEQLRESSAARFFNSFFKEYYRENQNVDAGEYSEVLETIPGFENPDIRKISPDKTIIDDLISSDGIFSVADECYDIFRGGSETSNGYIKVNGQRFGFGDSISLDDLISDYRGKILNEFEKIANEHASDMINHADKLERIAKNFSDESNIGDEEEGSDRVLGFEKIRDNEYYLYRWIEPFIMKRGGRYYAFGSDYDSKESKRIRVGTTVILDSDRIIIKHKPMVDKRDFPYTHPFVHSDRRICYGDHDFDGTRFNVAYDRNDPNIYRMLSQLMDAPFNTLSLGYTSSTILPVKTLDRFVTIANTKEEAKRYAREKGMDPSKSIRNNDV